MRRENFPVWPSLMLMLSMAYLFAPATIWRPSLTLLLFLWCLMTAIDFARGSEPETLVDPRFPARLPLRRPRRVRGAREIAFAIVAGALALTFGAHLFRPDPPPAEAPAAQEDNSGSAETQTPAENAETPDPPSTQPSTAEPSVTQPPAAQPETYTARAGDTFRSIARRYYGDASKASDLARANPDVKPNAKLRAGRKIRLPTPEKKPGD